MCVYVCDKQKSQGNTEEKQQSFTVFTEIYSNQVKFIFIAHFMYKTIQSAIHKIKALQQGVEEALRIHKII